jgi:predicted dehydrogenase
VDGQLGVGVIGVGAFGSRHAEVYKQLRICQLIGVADISSQRLDQVRSALQVKGYTDYHDLLARDDIHVVSVCTTDELHVEAAAAAAKAGKHVFVEKPLALTPEDCDTIIAACARSGVKLSVGHILRFDPRYHTAYEQIREGRIGGLVHLFARRNNSIRSADRLAQHTSVLFFLGIHDLDFINWCVGARAERVYAEATFQRLSNTPDTVLAVIRFPDGVIASLEASWVLPASHPGRLDARFEAVGTSGAVYVNGGSEVLSVVREQVGPDDVAGSPFEQPELFYGPVVLGERVGVLRDELSHFVHCVIDDTEPLVSGQDGRAAVELARAIQESFETGRVVELA